MKYLFWDFGERIQGSLVVLVSVALGCCYFDTVVIRDLALHLSRCILARTRLRQSVTLDRQHVLLPTLLCFGVDASLKPLFLILKLEPWRKHSLSSIATTLPAT